MTIALHQEEALGLRLQFPDSVDLSGERFLEFCAANRDLRIERSADGEIIIMPPVDSESGRRNSEINYQLMKWAKQNGTGVVFDSSAGFELPNGTTRSPDAAWIRKSRLEPIREKTGFLKICPDFVVELRSPSDRMRKLQAKMDEYIGNGAQLGWLIDPIEKRVHVYRPNQSVEELRRPESIDGGPLLPGFKLELRSIWAEELLHS